jgi:hypothetical protein
MKATGETPAANGEPETGASVPLGVPHVADVCMQAAKTVIWFDPESATKRLFPSDVGQLVVAVVMPAQRENANPEGLLPVG